MAKNFIGTNYVPGIRNNNPGNIRPGDNWVGMIGTANNFVVFKDMDYGFRALAVDLANKINKGYDTITKIITRYAPPSENDTASYINAVSMSTGFGVNQQLTADFNTLKKLMIAISQHEIGIALWKQLLTEKDVEAGIKIMPQSIIDRVKDFFQNNPAINAVTGHVANNGILYATGAAIAIVSTYFYLKSKKK
jgi:hypothetical protein